MYYIQTLLLAGGLSFFLIRRGRISGLNVLMISTWILGVSIIYWRYGPIGQWSFYQNDQYFHWRLASELVSSEFRFSFDQFNYLRLPYTGPAHALSALGVDSTLALKFVSLLCAIATVNLVSKQLSRSNLTLTLGKFWLVAGPIILFFSLLALRETMMVLCVSYLFLGESHRMRFVALIALLILRPHLAAAAVFGQAWGWFFGRLQNRWYLTTVLATCILPIFIGTIGFSIGNVLLNNIPFKVEESLFLKDQVIQIFSAFAGLQFLTVADQTVEFTTQSILFIRLIFPEIIIVPIAFTLSCFFITPHTSRLKLSVLSTFVFFMAVSSGTDYLSVRQTLPLMPVMGFVALLTFRKDSSAQSSATRNSTTSAVELQQAG